jgi:hypothetical protein
MVQPNEITDWSKPMVEEAMLRAVQNRTNPATAIMSTDDDVLDLQCLDSELQNRHAVEVCRIDDVRHVSMHEDFARLQASNNVGGYSTIGTSDPQEVRSL